MSDTVLHYIQEHRADFERELFQLLRIPSISADSSFAPDVRKAAQWLADHLREMGLAVELVETEGHPLVYAESPPVEGAPTALVYGHYDVQPPDPLDQWHTPPFEPDVRDGKVFARGATDDKGQMMTHVLSVASWIAAGEALPLQVKFLIEGEEEVGSEHLATYLADNRDRLGCDCIVISDTAQFAPGVPAITYGLRGIAYYELFLEGPNQDLHSGVFGGAVANPANALATLLASLVDDEGRIQVPGFYDDVAELSEPERRQLLELPFDEGAFRTDLGVDALFGEVGFSTLERRWTRPSFDVHGVSGGYQGEGAKTVLPGVASAKFSFRLVPNQQHAEITAGLQQHLQRRLPAGIRMRLQDYHGGPGVAMPLASPYLQAAADAIETGFGKRPVFIREGGSIPIVNDFVDALDADVLLLGWGQNDDNLHAPNEKFSLDDFFNGIRASAALWSNLAAAQP